jgi:2-methylisocitrate lyase-like PEP mutase family enzyme
MDDVLIDIRRITDASALPLLVDADTGWGGAFNIARTVRTFTKAGAAGLHIEDQVSAKRCGHRPGKEIVSQDEMVDRIKAAVDARTDESCDGTQKNVLESMQTRADLYKYLGYHAYEEKLDRLFAAAKENQQ